MGALAAGSVLLVLGGALVWAGLATPAGELPLVALVRIVAEWLLGLIFIFSGLGTLVAGAWTAIRGRHQVPEGLDRDLVIGSGWPDKADW
jgi:hypothetical protein